MKIPTPTVFAHDPSSILLKELTIRVATQEDYNRADELLNREHYLGATKARGHSLLQIIEYKDQWVALIDWGPAALKLGDRDEWIGWNGRQRADRRGLVVQNRRFLVLSETRMPNLASRSLALAIQKLPQHWEQHYGYRPLLAETFTDIEQFEGTCYKAAGWIACGQTKGYARHRADYYQKHERPKKLWLRPLRKDCRELLQGIELPARYSKAINAHSPERDLPVKKAKLDTLREAFREVSDPRASNRKFSISSLLTLIALALLAGRKNLSEIQRYGQFLNHTQRVWLDWPGNHKGTGRCTPSYSALYNLLKQIDPHAFATVLNEWMQTHYGALPRALAVDGKYVRDQVLTLCLSEHESGAPVAMAIADETPRTEDNKKEGELSVSRALYQKVNLDGAIITADALHCEKKTAELLIEQGADYVLQLKGNQPKALEQAQKLARGSPFLPTALVRKHTDV